MKCELELSAQGTERETTCGWRHRGHLSCASSGWPWTCLVGLCGCSGLGMRCGLRRGAVRSHLVRLVDMGLGLVIAAVAGV